MPEPPAWLGEEHAAAPNAVARATPASPMTRMYLCTTNRLPLLDRGSDQPQGRGAEGHQGGVEALEREPGAPGGRGPLAQGHDLQLAPAVAAVGRFERRPPGLRQRRRAGQVVVRCEPRRRLR